MKRADDFLFDCNCDVGKEVKLNIITHHHEPAYFSEPLLKYLDRLIPSIFIRLKPLSR